MNRYKAFKTKIRKLIGLVGVGEFVENPVEFNSKNSWNALFSNTKFIKSYVAADRLQFYTQLAKIIASNCDQKQPNVIDLGCGTAHLLKAISAELKEGHYTATDFVEEGLSIAKEVFPEATFLKTDLYESNEAFVQHFDIVICTEVLEHLLYPDKALKHILSYAKTGGKIVLTVPEGRKDTYSGHINFWSEESWKVFIETNLPHGFTASFFMMSEKRVNLAIITTD